MTAEATTWGTYEDVARYLLDKMREEFGLERVEGTQTLPGKSGTNWTIEGKGIKADTGAIIVIECRRYTTSKLKQQDIGAIAYRIGDLGAAGGIVVTPIGVQEGGEIIARYEGIEVVHLNADASHTDFVLQFLERVVVGVSAQFGATGTLSAEVQAIPPDQPSA